MKKTHLLVIFLLFLISACQPQEPPPAVTFPAALAVTPTPGTGSDSPRLDCQTSNLNPTPGPDEPSLFVPPSASEPARGPQEAAVTFIVYSDFQSRAGAELTTLLNQLRRELPNDMRIIYRHAPKTETYDKSMLAAQAAEAAAEQGKFWEMHDLLFGRQIEWVKQTPADFEQWLIRQAAGLGLDTNRFSSDLKRADILQRIEQDRLFAQETGILITPFVLINGQIYNGPLEYESLDRIVRLIALGKRQFTACPPVVIDAGKQYIATLTTEKGQITLLLYADKAPLTVNNFVFLARSGWYDHITWHRVLPEFLAQTGDPSGTGSGGPGYFFRDEIDPQLKFDRPGLVAMANYGPNTNGSQFFITYAPAENLNGAYTIFGEVLSGMEILKQLSPRDPQPGIYLPPGDLLLSVTVEEH